MQVTICSLCSNFLRTLHYHLHFCYRQLKLLKIPWKSFCPPQMEKTHSHNSSLMVFPGYFFSFYPKTFYLSEYGPSQKYNHVSTSILSFLPKSKEMQEMLKWKVLENWHNSTWKYIFRTCRRALFPPAGVRNCTDWNLRQPRSYFAVQMHSNFSQMRFWRVKWASKHQEQYCFNLFRSYLKMANVMIWNLKKSMKSEELGTVIHNQLKPWEACPV